MKITFCGAAQSVTGSKHLIESGGFRLLFDCGLNQGGHSADDQINRKLPFDPATIDAVILSHAHADHSGMLPILVRDGFKGKIYCTGATADIAKYILHDSAMVQLQEFNYAQEHVVQGQPAAHQLLYTTEDADNVLPHFETVPYFRLRPEWTQLNENIRFKLYDAGHILGSEIIYLEIKEDGVTKGLAFTGDIGQPGAPLLHDPEAIAEEVDALICEATYGARKHRPLSDAAVQLKEVINYTVAHQSKIIIPAFALGRTQELIYILHELIDKNEIPKIPMFVDSPLALNVGDVFSKHTEDFNDQTFKDFGSKNERPLAFANLQYVSSVEESKALNLRPGPFIIISSSGMMEGGRILHHLKNNIEGPANTVLITGYQAENTLGRKIQEGASEIEILGVPRKVRARIITMDEFSAHADQDFLVQYISTVHGLKKLFLVHNEVEQAKALREVLAARAGSTLDIEIPRLMQSFEV